MADEKLRYYIEALWTGKGAAVAAKEDIKGVGDAAKGGDSNLKGLNSMLSNVTAGLAAAGGAAAVFKTAFDLAEQGDQIQRTKEKFDALAETIHTTGDALLSGLREATHGAVSDLDLLTAGTTFMNMGFVRSQDEAESLIQKILLLKKPTEDTTTAIDNFSLMLANASVARLDSFGLSSGRVKARMEELQKATAGMTREQAFTIATMEEMSVAIDKQGLSVEDLGTSYERLKTMGINWLNEQKQMLDEGLEPWVKLLLGDYGSATAKAIDDNLQQAKSLEDLTAQFIKLEEAGNKPGATFLGMAGGIDHGKRLIAEGIAANVSSFEEFQAVMGKTAEAGIYTIEVIQRGLYDAVKTGQLVDNALGNLHDGIDPLIAKYKEEHAAQATAADSATDLALTTEELAKQQEAARLAAFRQHEGLIALRDGEQFAKEEQIARAEATAREAETDNLAAAAKARAAASAAELAEMQKAAAIASGDLFASFMRGNGELKFFNESLDDLGPQLVTVNGRTAGQNSELSRLQGIYSKAAQTIRDYDAGLKGVNLTEEGRAQKIAEQQTLMANAEAAMQPLLSVTGQLQTVNVGLTFNQQALNNAFIDAADAAGASGVQMALLTSTLGGYSEEAASALLQQTLMQLKINQLAADFVAEKISISEVKEELRLFSLQVSGTADAMLDSAGKADAMKASLSPLTNGLNDTAMAAETAGNKLRDIPTDIVVKISYNADPFPSIPSNPDGQKGGAGGNAGALMVLPGSGVAPLPPSSRRGSNGNNGGLNLGGVTLQIFVNGADMGKNPKAAARMLASNVIGELQAMVG